MGVPGRDGITTRSERLPVTVLWYALYNICVPYIDFSCIMAYITTSNNEITTSSTLKVSYLNFDMMYQCLMM